MGIIEFLKKSLEGKGIYVVLISIFSWIYISLMIVIVIYETFLYIFRVKYFNPDFDKEINEKMDENEE